MTFVRISRRALQVLKLSFFWKPMVTIL